MTREEKQKAIDILKISVPIMAMTQERLNDYIQTLKKTMDWLEQEPCEDAISRQDAIEEIRFGQSYITKIHPTGELEELFVKENQALEDAIKRIEQLPSVQPIIPRGHWIECEDEVKVYCSKCKEKSDYPTNYCQNCGADMRESEE